MSIAEFVSDLKKLDVRLNVNGQRLRVNAPKGVLTDSLRAQIAERKQELLQFLSDYEQPAAFIPPPILRRTSSDPAPLSFAQERLWFLEQLEPGSGVYNICRASRLTGQLNMAALESSLTEILRRHEILRSQIRIVDGRPVQVAVAVSRFEVPVIDLRSLTEPERDREVRDRIKAEAEWQFDFLAGLFLRAVLLQISNEQHIFILTTHHIVADAWSMGILTRELWTLYEAYSNGKPSPVQELPVQYTDYAVGQREWLQGEVLESQLSYWKEQLKELSILNLLTDHPRPVKQSFRGARQSLSLHESLTKAVNELSGREGVTQFMTLLAAFQVLLYRYSGQEDVVVGLPIANRNRTETEGLIGFFVNTLVLRGNLSEKLTFRELLQRVRNVCLQAYAHQDLPFEKLVEELRPERDLSRNPIFQVMFVLQNTPRPLAQPTALSIERVDILPATSLFDLSLYLRERDGKLIGFFEYSTDLFEHSTIERMIGHFETLLEGIVADPEQPIATLPLLDEAERHQLLVEWNDTSADYPKDVCIQDLFEAQVERTPDAIAVECEGKRLTYRELNRQANQVAHYLKELGVGPEKLVGICLERSSQMVIGLLGILKAGGAYLPLDPAYPSERLRFMLEDSKAQVLLAQSRLLPNIAQHRVLAIALDDFEPRESEYDVNLKRKANAAHSAAYVIYTSGSTGVPKGVIGLHRGAVNRFVWMWRNFPFRRNEKSCLKTSLSFVDSVWELFGPLLQGIPTIIMAEHVARDPRLLVRALAANRVSRIVLVPSLLKAILEAFPKLQDILPECTIWSTSGESLTREVAERFRNSLPNSTLLNLYGTSEVSGDVTWYDCHQPGSNVSIGRPISNTQIYLLDSCQQPVPIGVRGELYVGGTGLARGYLNRPELTAERFIANPFNDKADSCLYRTGDLARYLPEGNIEFLGRVDNQIKIRGYRIELSEIETVLNQHPLVRQSVVVGREDVTEEESGTDTPKSETRTARSGSIASPNSSALLIAYVVPTGHPPSLNEIRSFLKKKLPEYMVPSVFAMVDTIPLLPNGKVDRQNLSPAQDITLKVTQEFVESRTEIEELVAQTWREVLKVENVGIYDNFFDLGGNSLLATQIVARLQEAFNKDVPLRVLFDAPTIAKLAQELEMIIREGHTSELPPIMPVPRDGPLPLSINQEHLWHLDRMMPGTHFFNMPYAYQLSGELNVEALEKAFREIIRRHEALRTVFGEVDGKPVQIIKSPSDFRLILEDLRGMPRGEITKKATVRLLEERLHPFDLAAGPLIRVMLLRLTDRENLLLVTAHHIIADYWSMQVFRREIIALYEAFRHEKSSPLPEPVIQFGDYACWERRLLNDGLLDDHLVYWRNQLAGLLTESDYQVNRDNNTEPSFQFHGHSIEIKEKLLGELRVFAKRENSTLFIVLLTALIATLYVSTGQQTIRVGTLVANRGRRESEMTIGHFVNTVILRGHVSPELELKQLLGQIRDVTLRAQRYQEFPMEELMRELELKEGVDRASLFRVLINYQKHDSKPVHVSGLTFASWNVPYTNSEAEPLPTTFDLIFNLKETSTMLTGTVNVRDDNSISGHTMDVVERLNRVLGALVSDPQRLVLSLVRDFVETQNFAGT